MYFIRIQWIEGGHWYMGTSRAEVPFLPSKEKGFDSAGEAYEQLPTLTEQEIEHLEKLEVASWEFFEGVYDDEKEPEEPSSLQFVYAAKRTEPLRVVATARELLDRGVWLEFCELRGINEWAINEGRMDDDEQFNFTPDEAKKLGLIP